MRWFLPTPRRRVRWIALGLVLAFAACAPDGLPTDVDATPLTPVTAQAKPNTEYGQECPEGSGACVEFGTERRFRQAAWYPADGKVYECSVNAIEDESIPLRRTRNGSHLSVNKWDAIVMVREADSDDGSHPFLDEGLEEGWRVSHIGLARWTASFWFFGDGTDSSWNSSVSGIVAPWPVASGGPTGNGGLDAVFGGPGGDVADLEIPDASPGAPFLTAARELLDDAERSDLEALDCRANVNFFFGAPFVTVNSIDVHQPVPPGRYTLLK